MSGDYTRFTFRSDDNYSAVLKQQGRVDLDADFNELIEIVDRRWRSETIDVIGHCVVPKIPPGTPPALDPFLVIPTALGAFDIGIGRIYVDGIQVENHGVPPERYLADLGELRGTLPVPYSNQPYLPAPLPPPLAATPHTTDLVYLDVWQREVTVLEDPSLREIALGGPDTTTRLQAVWQVRVLQNVGQHGCADAIPLWDQTVAPSAGRLTTSALPPPAADDPCIISPSGGYRGLENRLYRVEIHATGTIGGGSPAKFKWSRNNASIASPVTAIPAANQITVQQIGRDRVLRFEVGNWIEITDDFREFQGLAGHMAQISAVDEANRLLTFAPAIPAGINFDATNASRHTRVRRWDETQNVDANGLLDVAAGPIDLEDGIRVSFGLDPAAGGFRVGDYWVLAARTADGSVETLTAAPPRGILHHYCRLGFINWGTNLATTTFIDCRNPWPRCDCEGHCTVTVGDGVDSHGQFTDIQQAIDALGNRGGVVCIARGVYVVRVGLLVNATKRNVIIRGMGPATRIVFVGERGSAFLSIQRTEHVRLEDLFVVAVNAGALVRIAESHHCRIERCALINLPGREGAEGTPPRTIDIAGDCRYCEILDNDLLGVKGVAATEGQTVELRVRDNRVLTTQAAIVIRQVLGIEILHNQLRGLAAADFAADPAPTRDTIDALQSKVSAAFRAAPTSRAFQAAGILIYTGNRVVIDQNLITAQVGILGFLLLNARIHRNDVLSLVGVLNIFGVRLKLEDNFIFGLFAGFIHAGIVFDVDCTSNEWLGFNGIIWMALAELLGSFGAILAGALGAIGFGGAFTTAAKTGVSLTADVRPFGLAVVVKVERNVFLTFFRGVYKTDPVFSADVSIVHNTFMLCSSAGIELGGSRRRFDALAPMVTLRHLIQGNSLAVRGRAIISSMPLTHVEQNSVSCPSVAIELDAPHCAARANVVLATGRELALDTGLVTLYRGADGARIAGNELLSAPGHAILVREDVTELSVEDNIIRGARGAGLATRHDGILIRELGVFGNHIEDCQGNQAAGMTFGGAVAIGSARGARIVDNRMMRNSPSAHDAFLRWYALYVEDADGIEVRGNAVAENGTADGLQGNFGAIGLQGVSGSVQVQDNVVRGNGGIALFIGESRHVPDRLQHALVQNNHLSTNQRQRVVFIEQMESLVFSGNECLRPLQGLFVFVPAIELRTTRGNVCGNAVDAGGLIGMSVRGRDLVVNANSVRRGLAALIVFGLLPARVVVTSNVTTGISAGAGGILIRGHNIPAP